MKEKKKVRNTPKNNLFENFDKSKFFNFNDNNSWYINDYLKWVHNEQLKMKEIGIEIPNPDDYTNKSEIEITPGMRRQLALKEKELMGISFTPLFEEYEELRFIKCTHDLRDIESIYESNESIESAIVMALPIKLCVKKSRKGNDNSIVTLMDEKYTKEIFITKYPKYRFNIDNIVINEPILALIKIKNGYVNLEYFSHCIEADKVEIPCINIKANNHEDVRIISKTIMSNIGDTPVFINGKKHDLKVGLSFKFKKIIQNYAWEILSENND